jgi:hypothetical protein
MAWDVESILGEFYGAYVPVGGMTNLAHTVRLIVSSGVMLDGFIALGCGSPKHHRASSDCALALRLYVGMLRDYESFRRQEIDDPFDDTKDRYGSQVDYVFEQYRRLTGRDPKGGLDSIEWH